MAAPPDSQFGTEKGSRRLEAPASQHGELGAPGRVELPTNGLGNRCSIHLSYGATAT